MHDAPPPPPYCSIKHLLQFGTLSTGTLAACGPPVHRRERGSTRSLKYQQAKPMQTRDTDRASTRRIEEAWADTFEPAGLAGTHGAQVVILEGLWLFQHAGVPDQECRLASSTQGLNAAISLLPQPIGNQAGAAARGT